jgi:hypothetical protein
MPGRVWGGSCTRDSEPASGDRSDETVANSRKGFDVAGLFRVIAEGGANLVNRKVNPAFEIDERGVAPETSLDFFSRDNLSRSFGQKQQDPQGLRLQLNWDSGPEEFASR